MFDISFYMSVYDLKQKLIRGELRGADKADLFAKIEKLRNKKPVIYNIETTNACNMKCRMCPRTTMMTRPVVTMDMDTFRKIAEQIEPFSKGKWQEWESFVKDKYSTPRNDLGENHFFLYIIPKVLVLHGYGDPLLDKYMPERIRLLTEKNIPSYFSCNPANIEIKRTLKMFENGLGYIKYSIDSVDDLCHKKIRGEASNFTESYKKIIELLSLKEKYGYKTTVVITMLNLNRPNQREDFKRLKDAFKDQDVYLYLKSQDQKWYENKDFPTQSLHWTEFCQFPWSSMTIKSNGEAVECVEDFNNEIIMGNAKKESLYEIWNGKKYSKFRQDHFDLTAGIKCTGKCDMKLIGNLI